MSKGKHRHSIAAFNEMIRTGARRTICLKIYDLMFAMPAMTERQIASRLGFDDIYTVRRRMSELIRDGVFVEDGEVLDTTTKKTVRKVRVATTQERLLHVRPDDNRGCPSQYGPTLEAIKAELLAMFRAHEEYGCGFYGDTSWLQRYEKLQTMVGFFMKGDE